MNDLPNAQAASNFLDAAKGATIDQNREMGLVTRGPNSGTLMNSEVGGAIANGTGVTTNPDAINNGFNPTPNDYTDGIKLKIADRLGPVDPATGNLNMRSPYTLLKQMQNIQRMI